MWFKNPEQNSEWENRHQLLVNARPKLVKTKYRLRRGHSHLMPSTTTARRLQFSHTYVHLLRDQNFSLRSCGDNWASSICWIKAVKWKLQKLKWSLELWVFCYMHCSQRSRMNFHPQINLLIWIKNICIYFIPDFLTHVTLTFAIRSKDLRCVFLVVHLFAAWSGPSSDLSEQRGRVMGVQDLQLG